MKRLRVYLSICNIPIQTEPEIDPRSVGQEGLCSKDLIMRCLRPGRGRKPSSCSVYQAFTKMVARKKIGKQKILLLLTSVSWK